MIRRLYTLLVAALLTSSLLSCGDDDVTSAQDGITIVRSDLLFEPLGRTGSVEVRATGTIAAHLQSEWCRAEVEGNTVSVTVDDNDTFEGRTALLTITAGDSRLQLPVQQRGMALGSLAVSADHIGSNGGRLAYYIRHDLPINLDTDEDWLHAHMEGDSLIIDIDANDTWHIRRGRLDYECAGYTGQLDIAQYDLGSVLGQYFCGGSNSTMGFRFNLVERDGRFYMVLFTVESWADLLVPVDFDIDRCELTLYSATTIYTDNVSALDAIYFYNKAGKVATSASACMKASIYYNPFALGDTGTHYAMFEDTGSWNEGPLTGLLIRAIRPYISTNLAQLDNPYILWMGEAQQ